MCTHSTFEDVLSPHCPTPFLLPRLIKNKIKLKKKKIEIKIEIKNKQTEPERHYKLQSW